MGENNLIEQKKQNTLPDYMKGTQVNETDIDFKEIQIPRINIAQPNSKDVLERGMPYGNFLSSLGEDLGTTLEFIVIKPFINYVYFNEGKLMGRSSDGKIWEEGALAGTPVSEQGEAWKFKRINFYVILKDSPSGIPYIISMYSKSGSKTGQKIYSNIATKMAQGIPCFAYVVKVHSNKTKNDIGSFGEWVFDSMDELVSEATFNICKEARAFIDLNASLFTEDDTHTPSYNAPEGTTYTATEPAGEPADVF